MVTETLIPIAIAAYLTLSWHGGNFGSHAAKSVSRIHVEKIVIREDSLSEKLGLETIARPDEEIVALQSSASGLKSVLTMAEQIKKQTPDKLPNTSQWKDKFVVTWDEAGGFYFDRTYHPGTVDQPSDQTQIFSFNVAGGR